MMNKNQTVLLFVAIILNISCVYRNAKSHEDDASPETVRTPEIPSYASIERSVVYNVDGQFSAWPANNGVWHFNDDDKILVGFTKGDHS